MAELIVEVIDGTLSPLAQALMQTGLLPAGVTPEIITLSGGVGECYRHQPADPFCFADIGPLLERTLLTTALRHTQGHKQKAARLLGWGHNTLTRKLKELGME